MAKVKARAEKAELKINKSFWSEDRNVAYVLGAFAFLLYAQTIGFGYALDDVAVLKSNDFVHQGFRGFKDILTTFYWHGNASFADANSGLFRPLSLLLFATEWQIFGDRPAVFHFVHLVLYAITAMQLYLLLTQLFGKSSGRLALVATLLWIVLPVHSEVVANLKSADEILSLLFSLLMMRWLLKWNDNPGSKRLLLAGVFFFLALLSKEAAVLMLPLALLMLIMFRQARVRQLIQPTLLLIGIAAVWLAWHEWVIRSSDSPRITYDYRHNALLSSSSFIDQSGTAIGLQARYWVKMLVGYPLSYNYSFNEIPVDGFASIWTWIAIAGTGAAVFFAWRNFRKQPALSFAIIFYFVTIALTSNIFFKIGDIFAERFTFAPSIGFCILLAIPIVKNQGMKLTSRAVIIVSVICLAYSIRTLARSNEWKTEDILFISDADHSPNSARVHDNVGVIYLNSALGTNDATAKKQLFEQAYQEYLLAFQIDTLDFSAAQALGQISYHKADYTASVNWSRKSIALRRKICLMTGEPIIDDPTTMLNLGDAFIKLDQFDSAVVRYQAALKIQPRADVSLKIGDAYLRAKDTTAAIHAYQNATQADSVYIDAWDKIANLKGMQKDYAGSNDAFYHLTRLDSLNLNTWKMIYTNYSMMGDSLGMQSAAAEYYKRGGK